VRYFLLSACWLLTVLVKKLISQEKKLDKDEEEAGEDLLKLHEELATLQARMAVAAGRLSRIRKTKNKVKERRASEFRRGIQGLEGEDKLAEELSRRENEASEELQSLNPEGIDWDSLGLGDFNFDPLSSDVVGESSSGVVGH
jgi:chromosome segregation ATPase